MIEVRTPCLRGGLWSGIATGFEYLRKAFIARRASKGLTLIERVRNG